MSNFGTYQQYLVYRELAKHYDHEAVIVSILPENDFRDNDYGYAKEAGINLYRYRPYLINENGQYRQFFFKEPSLYRFLRRNSYTVHAVPFLIEKLGDWLDEMSSDGTSVMPKTYPSMFYEFTNEQYELLEHILNKLIEEANDKYVILSMVPVSRDFNWYQRHGPDPLTTKLRRFAIGRKVIVVDFLSYLYEKHPLWQDYFFSCDFHWNARANHVASQYLKEQLRGIIYPDPVRRTGEQR
jgi:hypothetical protein